MSVNQWITDPFAHDALRQASDYYQRRAKLFLVVQLLVSFVGFAIGIKAHVFVENLKSGAFWSHTVPPLAVACLLVGVHNKRSKYWIIAGLLFECASMVLCITGCVLDAMMASNVAKTNFGECGFNRDKKHNKCGYILGTHGLKECLMPNGASECFCCDVYRQNECRKWGYSLHSQPDRYGGVTSCDDVSGLYKDLLWSSMSFCIINFVTSVIILATIGQFVNTRKQLACSNPTQHSVARRRRSSVCALVPYPPGPPCPIDMYSSGIVVYRTNRGEQRFPSRHVTAPGECLHLQPPPYTSRPNVREVDTPDSCNVVRWMVYDDPPPAYSVT